MFVTHPSENIDVEIHRGRFGVVPFVGGPMDACPSV